LDSPSVSSVTDVTRRDYSPMRCNVPSGTHHITLQHREHNPDIHFCEKRVSHTWMKVQSAKPITK